MESLQAVLSTVRRILAKVQGPAEPSGVLPEEAELDGAIGKLERCKGDLAALEKEYRELTRTLAEADSLDDAMRQRHREIASERDVLETRRDLLLVKVAELAELAAQAITGSIHSAWSNRVAEAARAVSIRTGASMAELANALKSTLSVGLDLGEQFQGTRRGAEALAEAAAKLHIVGRADLGDTTRLLTNLMNSFQSSIDSARDAADAMFVGFQKGGGELEFFSEGLGVIASTMAALGGNFNDTVAAVALMTRAAEGNSRVFLELTQSFSTMIQDSEKLGDLLAQTATGGVDLFATLDRIRAKVDELGGLGTVKTGKFLKGLFPDIRGLRAVSRLLAQTPEEILEVRRAVEQSSGALDRMFALVSDTSREAIRGARSAFGRLAGMVGEQLDSVVQRVANFFRDAFSAFRCRASPPGRERRVQKPQRRRSQLLAVHRRRS